MKQKYQNMVASWAEIDARWIKQRGECRTKWRQIRWDTIKNWQLPSNEKTLLYNRYVKLVDEKAPVVIPKAPSKSSIAVSKF